MPYMRRARLTLSLVRSLHLPHVPRLTPGLPRLSNPTACALKAPCAASLPNVFPLYAAAREQPKSCTWILMVNLSLWLPDCEGTCSLSSVCSRDACPWSCAGRDLSDYQTDGQTDGHSAPTQ
jgi:hypothetical protein